MQRRSLPSPRRPPHRISWSHRDGQLVLAVHDIRWIMSAGPTRWFPLSLCGARRFGEVPATEGHRGHGRDGRYAPGRSGDSRYSGSPNQDQARLRRRRALVGRSAASSVFRLRAADGEQQGRLTPIGFCLGGFSRSRAGALRRPCLLRQAAFQRCHQVNDCWRSGHFPGFDREPLHLGFNQLAQGLLVAVSIRRRIETPGPLTDDRARDRDHLGVEIPLDATELRRPGPRLQRAT